MPVWLEISLAWVTIGAILNLAAYTVFRKRGYFKWLNDVHDNLAYRIGYEDAKKDLKQEIGAIAYSGLFNGPTTRSALFPQLYEHGAEDFRYK